MASGPEISVVVGAYSRREYLLGAVRSLDGQTLERDRFEIVVTKNFRDPEIDRALDRSGAVVLFDDEHRVGRWLRRAVARTTAPIVTFLNDDDEYEPERLAEVLATWRRLPELGFYRNRVRVIDRGGLPVAPDRWRRHETDREFDRNGAVYLAPGHRDGVLELANGLANPTFNTSTMALRRDLLDGEVGEEFERVHTDDLFLFVASVLSPYGLYLDDRRLTRFRFTNESVTHTVAWLGEAVASYAEIADFAWRRGSPALAAWLRGLSVHFARMHRGSELVERIRGQASREEVAHRTGEYLRFLGHHPGERRFDLDTWGAVAYGLVYLEAPPLVRRLVALRPTSRL